MIWPYQVLIVENTTSTCYDQVINVFNVDSSMVPVFYYLLPRSIHLSILLYLFNKSSYLLVSIIDLRYKRQDFRQVLLGPNNRHTLQNQPNFEQSAHKRNRQLNFPIFGRIRPHLREFVCVCIKTWNSISDRIKLDYLRPKKLLV